MSTTSSPRYDFPMTPEQFGAMLAEAEPSVFFSLLSSVLETISATIRLIRGTSDEYQAVNWNWARVSSALFRGARSLALLIALLLFIFAPAAAASMFFGGIVVVTALYNAGKAGWSLYKLLSYKDNDPAHKADLKKHFKSNLIAAVVAVAAAAAMFALVAAPIGAAVLTALAITASVIGFLMVAYTVFQFAMKHRNKTTLLDKLAEEVIDTVKDEAILELAQQRSAARDKMTFHDYQYAVNYAQVVHAITSRKAAHQFLKNEIFDYRMHLEKQCQRDSWLDHIQAKKRQAKLTLLEYFDTFMDHIDQNDVDHSLTFTEAFEAFLTTDQLTNYMTLKNSGTQSFFRHKGRFEDLCLRGLGQHWEQIRLGQYATMELDDSSDNSFSL